MNFPRALRSVFLALLCTAIGFLFIHASTSTADFSPAAVPAVSAAATTANELSYVLPPLVLVPLLAEFLR